MARAHRGDGGRIAVRIHLCGELAVAWDGESLADRLPARQGRILFAYLVLHRARPVRRDELEEVLEGSSLAPPLSRLRKALGEGRLEGRAELRLVLPEDAWIDLEVAHDGIERARTAMRAGAWADAWGPATAARAIAERGLLPGLEAPWLDPLRAGLADLRVEALEALARTGAALGGAELAPAARAARAAIEAAPFRESAYAALMDALRAEGNVAEALLVFERLRTVLREELGTSPAPDLVAKHEGLLRGEAGGGAWHQRVPTSGEVPGTEGSTVLGRCLAPDGLVEREAEVATLSGLLRRASYGEGGVVVVEGAAGVGKTRLVAELRALAAAGGARVLVARAGELERDFAFGVVRQLFEAEVAGRELEGAAAPAAAVFGAAGAGADMSFAALHGLYWLTHELAAERPLLLAVDDVQWADPASLRWLVYLARRLEGMPVLLAATLRSGEAPTDQALLDDLLQDPATTPIRPGPLSLGAVRELVADALGDDPDDAFVRACREATAGNPLLLGRLLAALREDGVRPEAANVGAVGKVGVRAVARSVRSRMTRLSIGANQLAEAVALLGEGARLDTAAAVAGLTEHSARDAAAVLVGAEILRPDSPLGFVHPLVRDAVYHEATPVEREERHYQAAFALEEIGAPVDEIALQLLAVPPRGDGWVANVLREAGRAALRRGAVDSALAHLRRALAEPPHDRAPLLLELGAIERDADAPAAAEHLRKAYATLEDPRDRAAAAELHEWALCFVGPPDHAVRVMEEALTDLPIELEDERRAIEALGRFTAYWYGLPSDHERWAELRAQPPAGDGAGTKMLLAATAWQWAVSDGPADRCVELALRAFEGGTLLEHDPSLMSVAAGSVLTMADHAESLTPWDTLRTRADIHGGATVTVAVQLWRGWALARRGELEEAEASLREGLAGQVLWGLGAEVRAYTVGLAAETLLERGDVAGVRALIEGAVEPPPGSDLRTFLEIGRAQLALAEGDLQAAVAATDDLGASPIENPAWGPWRSARALALHGLGRDGEAVALAWQDLGFAKRWGAPGATGRALRVLGTVEGEGGLEHLRGAVATLDGSPARLELAKARAALGDHLLRAGRPADAAHELHAAAALADECGALPLAATVRGRLADAGIAPRRGPVPLTALERRVAALAAEGVDPSGVAQALFLTPRAAREHLDSARRKLSASGTEDLRAALAGGL